MRSGARAPHRGERSVHAENSKRARWGVGLLAQALLLPGCALGGSAHPNEIRGRVRLAVQDDPAPPVPAQFVSARSLAAPESGTGRELILHRPRRDLTERVFVVPAGQEIRFRNVEQICHQFFSSSAPNAFDLGVLGPAASGTVQFDHPGFVRVYCSLHAGEESTILVLPTPHYARVDPNGEFRIRGLRPGRYLLELWCAASPPQSMEWTVGPGQSGVAEFAAPLPEAPR